MPVQMMEVMPVSMIWRNYTRGYGTGFSWYFRAPKALLAIFFVMIFFALGISVLSLFPAVLRPPMRMTGLADYMDSGILLVALLSFWMLLFFALDHTVRAICLARQLAEQTDWPVGSYEKYCPASLSKEMASNSNDGREARVQYFDDWLDTQLIAHATVPVQRILFYPFPVLALLVLARSSVFDGWNIPLALYVMFLVPVALMLIAGWILRDEAEKVRHTTMRWLSVRKMDQLANGSADMVKQIETMYEQVRTLRIGAFASVTERPMVRGVLTLAGTVSGVALLEYGSMFGI